MFNCSMLLVLLEKAYEERDPLLIRLRSKLSGIPCGWLFGFGDAAEGGDVEFFHFEEGLGDARGSFGVAGAALSGQGG